MMWAQNANTLTWYFKDGLQGWTPANFVKHEITKEGFKGNSKYDCQLLSPQLNIKAKDYTTLVVAIRTDIPGGGEIFFGRKGQSFKDDRKMPFYLNPTEKCVIRRIPLENAKGWIDDIDRIRFDPINPANANITIEFISLINAEDTLLENGDGEFALDGKTIGWTLGKDAEVLSGDDAASGKFYFSTKSKDAQLSCSGFDVSYLGTYKIEGMTKGKPMVISAVFENKAHSVLETKSITSAESQKWTPFELVVEAPDRAFFSRIDFASHGLAFVDNLKVTNLSKGSIVSSPAVKATWHGKWIWAAGNVNKDNCTAWLRKSFTLPPKPWSLAKIQLTCDDSFTLFVNGKEVGTTKGINDAWKEPRLFDLNDFLVEGNNILMAEVADVSSAQGFIAEIMVAAKDKIIHFYTGKDWEAALTKDGPWKQAYVIGNPPCPPWLDLRYEPMGVLPAITAELGAFGTSVVQGEKVPIPVKNIVCNAKGGIGARASLYTEDGQLIYESWADLGVIFPSSGKAEVRDLILNVPSSAKPGKALVKVDFPGALLPKGALVQPVEILVNQKKTRSEFPKTKLVNKNGLTNIKINGDIIEPTELLFVKPDKMQQKNSLDSGVHLWGISLMEMGLYESGYDYTKVDNTIKQYLDVDPNAWLVLNFTFDTAYHKWWIKQHPEVSCRKEDGSDNVGNYSGGRGVLPSYGSPVWRDFYTDILRRLIRHLKETPYAARIVGFHPCSGISWEWFHWGAQSNEAVDYSECSQNDFRRWLKDKYVTDAALQKAWKRTDVTLATAAIPSEKRRRSPEAGMYYSVKTQYDVLDYHDYQHDVVIDTIEHFGRVVKEETDGRSLFGTYYGYTMHLYESPFFGQGSGHFRLRKLLDSKVIDYAIAPVAYSWRFVGSSAATMIAPWTFTLNGKLFWNQADLRTHWAIANGHGAPQDVFGSVGNMEKELARNLAEGNAIQWYDFSNGWTMGDKRLTDEIKRQSAIINDVRNSVEGWNEDKYLLVVVDENLMGRFNISKPPYAGELVYNQRNYLALSGIPWRAILFSDLMKHKKLLKYKAMLFLNQFRLDEKQARFIKDKVLTGNRLVCFVGPVGIFNENGLTPDTAKNILGYDFEMITQPTNLRGIGTDFFPELNGKEWGNYYSVKFTEILLPRTTGKANVIGTLREGGRPAALYEERKDCKLFWSSVPGLTPPLLRSLAQKAGLPVISTTNDPLFAGNGFIGIHAGADGTKTLNLIGKGTPRDLLSNQKWPKNSKSISFDMKVGDTKIIIME